ncbi:hypothetical protein H072_2259 [Dactylellina haptotyla CBS 200.50]|uniref:Extracellular membrane protein CFEM domain-containing protein n=1 Tax=Dactylellina haptotyla (strain CBS 200.50) TaxID=1284197 RepID=S8ALC9_DACHA|nr:hypothetical protein H072_2259 [Dactylellina haptotyla CBS 200.50]
MLFKAVIIATLSSIAAAQNGQTFSNPSLSSCAISCIKTLQSELGCDPTLLTCACPYLPAIVSNIPFDTCLANNCGSSGPGDAGFALGKNCGSFIWQTYYTTFGAGGNTPMTSAVGTLGTSPAQTTAGSGQNSSPTTSATSGTKTNAAGRLEVEMVALGIALAAAVGL